MTLSRLLGVLTAVTLVLLGAAPQAEAHTSNATYLTVLTSITPAVPGLTVTVRADGSEVRVVNRSATPVVVLGYEGEPYLRLSGDEVWQNSRSPAAYLNALRGGGIPPDVDPVADPRWERVSTGQAVTFRDNRLRWTQPRSAVVAQHPRARHLLRTWTLIMLAGPTRVDVVGGLWWVPPPAPSLPLLVPLFVLVCALPPALLVVLERLSSNGRRLGPGGRDGRRMGTGG